MSDYLLEKGKAISKLFDDDIVESLSQTAPVAALKWCSANLSLANHLGWIETASKWKKYGLTLAGKVLQADIDTIITFYNHAMVFDHNRFSFNKNFPVELKRLMEFLESQYRQKCDFGCTTDLPLGRFYGTIMQTIAFCGPGYIEESEKFSQKARKALGEGATPEFMGEWKRHLSYITFARLDAQAFVKAEQSLKAYLEIEQLEDILIQIERPDAWGYALLARFFRQIKDHPFREKFYHWIEPMLDDIIMNTHPWQLFAYNTELIAHSLGHIDDTVKLMNRSIDICFADHFNFLKETDFQIILEKVRKYPERIFPFTYR